jgi:peptidoglycan/xylan/chitin deacetylase (PgdA/CDA1 family)
MRKLVFLLVGLLLLTSCVLPLIPKQVYAIYGQGAKVVLCFDDGYVGQYVYAKPILSAEHIKATFFVISNDSDDTFESQPLMTWTQINTLQGLGHDIESHGYVHHRMITAGGIKIADLQNELNLSRFYIDAEIGGGMPKYFAYPYGEYNATIQAVVEDYYTGARTVRALSGTTYADYVFAVSTDELTTYQYDMPACDVKTAALSNTTATIKTRAHTMLDTFIAHVNAVNETHYFVAIFHQFTASPRALPYCDVEPSVLQDFIDYAQSKNCTFTTYAGMMSSVVMTNTLASFVEVMVTVAVIGIVMSFVAFRKRN